jgi:glycerol-3-phosphate dehydrogenase
VICVELCPSARSDRLRWFRFFDAQTDDARLVLRLIRESCQDGALAFNYARVTSLLKTNSGKICGVVIQDETGETRREKEVHARVVINATGAWADVLRGQLGHARRLRPLRGSHLVFQASRLPLTRAVTFLHSRDGRPVFVLPWEGAVIYGTTDVDQGQNLVTDQSISSSEADYLLEGLKTAFPSLELNHDDVMATFSGIRPVVDTGKTNPSGDPGTRSLG